MKSSLAAFLSYVFMTSIIVLLVSAFGTVIVGARYFFTTISETEKSIGFNFLIIFIVSGILAPILLYLNQKMDRLDRVKEDDYY